MTPPLRLATFAHSRLIASSFARVYDDAGCGCPRDGIAGFEPCGAPEKGVVTKTGRIEW